MPTKSFPLEIRRVTAGNPFVEYPQLRSIWHSGLHAHIEADTVSDLAGGMVDMARNHVFLVLAEGQVVGITGFYVLAPWQVGLRWHGIVPEARGLGYSLGAFRLLCSEVTNAFHEARVIVELVEMSDEKAPQLIQHFRALGFQPLGIPRDAMQFPASTALPVDSGNWQEMVCRIRPDDSLDAARKAEPCGKR